MAPDVLLEADFRALGLEPGAKPSEVRQAYRALVKQWHPDRHHSEPYEARAFAEKKFREIDEAYRRISRSWAKTHASRAGGQVVEIAEPQAPGPALMPINGLEQKPRPPPPPAIRAKIDKRLFAGTKIVVPVLLLATAIFILTQLPSFFPDNSVDTETLSPQTVEHSPEAREPNNPKPPEATGPQSSADLTANPSPASPPALLQPQPEAPSAFFTLGSTTSEVLGIQGTPSRVQGQTWTYGLSEIQFRNGRVGSSIISTGRCGCACRLESQKIASPPPTSRSARVKRKSCWSRGPLRGSMGTSGFTAFPSSCSKTGGLWNTTTISAA